MYTRRKSHRSADTDIEVLSVSDQVEDSPSRFLGQFSSILKRLLGNAHPKLGPYVQLVSWLYYGAAFILLTPVYVAYDERKGRYRVLECHKIQRGFCLLLQLSASLSILHRVFVTLEVLQADPSVLLSYFDVASEGSLNLLLFYHFYLHWFRTERIERFLEVIQSTMFVRFEKTSAWKGKLLVVATWTLMLYLTISCLRTLTGMDFTTWSGFVRSGEENARYMFWIGENSLVSPFVTGFVIVSRFYNVLCHENLCYMPPILEWVVYLVVTDLFSGLLEQDLTIEEVLKHYYEFKEFIRVSNDYISTYLMQIIYCCMFFNSVHLLQSFSFGDLWWNINMVSYQFLVIVTLWIPATLLATVKKIKIWLRAENNYLKLSPQQLSLLLHDMIPWVPRAGLKSGRYTVITSQFSGVCISSICSYSLLVTLSLR